MGKISNMIKKKAAFFFTNLKGPLPWPKKLGLLFRNNWIKIRHLQSCCGHPGEPGC
ncbi:MAG: hypothetical protein ACP5Q3_12500 [bacterium]